MFVPLPRPAPWLGLAGLLPFLGTLLLAWMAPDPALRGQALSALAAYGAVILSFLGAVHWGFALAMPDGRRFGAAGPAAAPPTEPPAPGATPARLGLGVLPSLAGWLALLLPVGPGLLLLSLAIVITAAVEHLAAAHGLLPDGYRGLRWLLSLVAAACLLTGATLT